MGMEVWVFCPVWDMAASPPQAFSSGVRGAAPATITLQAQEQLASILGFFFPSKKPPVWSDAPSYPQTPASAPGKVSCWQTHGPRRPGCPTSPVCRQDRHPPCAGRTTGPWGTLGFGGV